MLEILFRNFQLLVCCGLLHQLPVTKISDPFCHSVYDFRAILYDFTLPSLCLPDSRVNIPFCWTLDDSGGGIYNLQECLPGKTTVKILELIICLPL
jgi:hypothetical protein